METIGKSVGNLSTFGWEWFDPDSGTQFQLVYPRSTGTLHLGMRPKGAGWTTMPVAEPQRFLNGEQPKTAKAWRAVVDRWFAAAETP